MVSIDAELNPSVCLIVNDLEQSNILEIDFKRVNRPASLVQNRSLHWRECVRFREFGTRDCQEKTDFGEIDGDCRDGGFGIHNT